MKFQVSTSRSGVRLIPSRMTYSGTTVTHSTGQGDYASVALASSTATHTFKYPSVEVPHIHATVGTTSAGGFPQAGSVTRSGFSLVSRSESGGLADNSAHQVVAKFDGVIAWHGEPIQDVLISSPYCLEYFRVTGTGTAAISTHASRATLTDNGTGDYTITLREPCANGAGIVALACPVGSTVAACGIHAVTANSVQVKTYSHDGSAADADFFLFLFCPENNVLHGNNYVPLMSVQPKTRIEFLRYVISGAPVIQAGPSYYSAENSGTGVHVFTSSKPFLRNAHVFVSGSSLGFAQVDSVTSSAFTVRTFNASGSAASTAAQPLYIMVVGNDDAREVY